MDDILNDQDFQCFLENQKDKIDRYSKNLPKTATIKLGSFRKKVDKVTTAIYQENLLLPIMKSLYFFQALELAKLTNFKGIDYSKDQLYNISQNKKVLEDLVKESESKLAAKYDLELQNKEEQFKQKLDQYEAEKQKLQKKVQKLRLKNENLKSSNEELEKSEARLKKKKKKQRKKLKALADDKENLDQELEKSKRRCEKVANKVTTKEEEIKKK